jgi:hypothetical protein
MYSSYSNEAKRKTGRVEVASHLQQDGEVCAAQLKTA